MQISSRKRIYHPYTADRRATGQLLAIQHRRARQPCGLYDQSVPKRNLRQPMQFNGSDHIACIQPDNPS